MPDTDYLQRMRYFKGEFLEEQDFVLEQSYIENQFKTLFNYYFSVGIAGKPQEEIETICQLFRNPEAINDGVDLEQPCSFCLKLVCSAKPSESQDDNYISVGKGFAVDPLARQIVLLKAVFVDKSCFANVKGDKAHLTIAYGEHLGPTNLKVIVQQPIFRAVEPNDADSNALYLATVTLKDKAIVGVQIEQNLRKYSRPYTISKHSNVSGNELLSLRKKIAQLEDAVKFLKKNGNSNMTS